MDTLFNRISFLLYAIQYNYDGHNWYHLVVFIWRYLFSGYYCVKCFLSMISFHRHNHYYSHFTDEELRFSEITCLIQGHTYK